MNNELTLQQKVEESFERAKQVAVEQGMNFYSGEMMLRYVDLPLADAVRYAVQDRALSRGLPLKIIQGYSSPVKLAEDLEIDLSDIVKRVDEVYVIANQYAEQAKVNRRTR